MLESIDRCQPVKNAVIDDHMRVSDGTLYFEDELGEAQIELPSGWCIGRFMQPQTQQADLLGADGLA